MIDWTTIGIPPCISQKKKKKKMYIIYILEIFIQSVTVGHSEEKKSEFSKRGDLLATIVQMLHH